MSDSFDDSHYGRYGGEVLPAQPSGRGPSGGRDPDVRPSGRGRIDAKTGALELLRFGSQWTSALCPFVSGFTGANRKAKLVPCSIWCPHLDVTGDTGSLLLIRLTCGGSARVLDGTSVGALL